MSSLEKIFTPCLCLTHTRCLFCVVIYLLFSDFCIGGDFNRAMVATAPGEKTPHMAPPREELDSPYDIELVFVQQITSVLRKINKKTAANRSVLSNTPWESAPVPSYFF